MQRCMPVLMFLFVGALWLHGQTGVDDTPVNAPVPLVVRFSSNMRELDRTVPSGLRSITFALYKDQSGGAPLWLETQTVWLDNQGHFTVLLGSSSTLGVPPATFAAGQPRWIGITPDDGVERPRLELVSVPYAFKAADADTLDGKRPDEFVSLQQLNSILKAPNPTFFSAVGFPAAQVESESLVPHLNADLLHGFPDSAFAKLNKSNVFSQPQFFPGGIDMAASNPEANAPNLLDSAPLDFESSSQDSQTNSLVKQRFRWVSQSLPGATAVPSARLSLYFGANGATPSSTGLSFNSDGTINFALGQQLPTGGVVSGGGGTGTGTGGIITPVVNTAGYSWNQAPPHATALQVGTNTVTLTPCPRGVNGTDVWHYLYISVTGTPEVVLITGGTCTSGARSGTIEFTANYPHPIGYFIGSATDGVQEAVIAADVPNTNGQISRQVLIDPGSHLFRARLSIRSSGMTVMTSGAIITCAMSDTCIMLGDPSNANTFQSIVVQGLAVAAGVKSGTWPAVEDNANGSHINNLVPALSATPGASFGSLVQIDNDQAATIDGLNTTLSYTWGRCDTTFCSTTIVGPGPFSKNAGVLWIQNSNISLQCVANGIDNQNGNTLHVSNSVVQGYAQFGIRARTVYNPTTVQLDSVYFEEDGYCNPLGTGSSGLIVEGGMAFSTASNPAGIPPQFTNTGNTQYYYYIVVHSSTMGTSPAYLAGEANTSGSGAITVLWNQVGTAGVITYDVLRITGDGGADMLAPYGTGSFAVATGVPATLCSNKVCSIVDNAGRSPSSYTVSAVTNYWPALTLWPGTVILTTASDSQNQGGGNPTTYFTNSLSKGTIVNSAGSTYPSVFAQECQPQGTWSSIWMQCLGGNSVGNDYPAITATLLQMSNTGGSGGGLKGRMIFEIPPGSSIGGTHVITLADSNSAKTLATPNNRPPWDPNDTFIGYDQVQGVFPSSIQLSLGSPVSISQYIGNPGDGVNYLERLTAAAKVFKVPVQMTQIRTGTLANTDAAGILVISGGATASYTFTGAYNSPLSCGLTPLSDPTETGVYWATITNTTLTVNVKVPGNVSFSYQCWGRQ